MSSIDRRSDSICSTDSGVVSSPAAADPRQDQRGDRLYRVVRAAVSPLFRAGCRVRTEGLDNVPVDGPVILAANHVSFFDSVVLTLSVPRRMRFVGKAEYLDSWKTRFVFPALGMIPIRRSAGRQAMAALDTAAEALEKGDMLGIYPEGTRSRDGLLHRGHTGVAQLALRTNAMIIPIGLVGTARVQPIGAKMPRPFHSVVARFGKPIDPSSYEGSQRRRRRQIRDDLMDAIRRLSGQKVSSDFAGVDATPARVVHTA